jgi:UDP-glucose 4-epimerase
MEYIVTGCAGFIGSNLVDRLLSDGKTVLGIDNFSTGQRRFLESALTNPNYKLVECDLLDLNLIKELFSGGSVIFHLAANADVRFGLNHPFRDLEQNTIVTFNVLEAMRANNIKRILFSSTGSVYGEAQIIPTPETAPFPIQTSLYGASKVACEGLISAYAEGYGFEASIFRFVSILGERYTHGHIFDFTKKLLINPNELNVLGNGRQRKSYLYVSDCINAMLLALSKTNPKVDIFNLGVNDFCEVNDSIKWILSELNLNPKIVYSGGDRGWIGDNPFIFLDNNKIVKLGWAPKKTIEEGVRETVKYLLGNKWLFEARE